MSETTKPDMYYMEIDGERRNLMDKQAREGLQEVKEAQNGLEFGISENGCLTVTYDDGE